GVVGHDRPVGVEQIRVAAPATRSALDRDEPQLDVHRVLVVGDHRGQELAGAALGPKLATRVPRRRWRLTATPALPALAQSITERGAEATHGQDDEDQAACDQDE